GVARSDPCGQVRAVLPRVSPLGAAARAFAGDGRCLAQPAHAGGARALLRRAVEHVALACDVPGVLQPRGDGTVRSRSRVLHPRGRAVASRILGRTRHAFTALPVDTNPYVAYTMTGNFREG